MAKLDAPVADLANMGPHLRGVSPPFTPSGRAAFAASNVPYTEGTEARNQAGHEGILVRWRADRSNAEKLLPSPLEPNERTDQIYLFLNQTQTGKSPEFIQHENPQLMNWHEALFMIPCSFEGRRCLFVWALYKDPDFDAGIVLGCFRGFVNKAARFTKLWPFEGQPLNREMAPGRVARMIVSRMDEKIVDCSFRATRELSRDEIAAEIDMEELLSDVGIRFLPDWSNPSGAPLVHDLVLHPMGKGTIPRAWAGDCTIRFGDSDADELDLLQPVEMLPSHFIQLQYQGGPGLTRVIHDYVERRRENGRIVRTRTSGMGPHLKGQSPPFTPSGKAAFMRSTDLASEADQEDPQAGHIGLMLRWRMDRRNAEMLLPAPLEPSETTDKPYLFLNQTQTAINVHGDLWTLNPHHVVWHEALVNIPCLFEGKKASFIPFLYKDVDHGVYLGMCDGFWTKLATFHETFPFRAQPLNSRLEEGSYARMLVSRFDERLITAEFHATRQVSEDEIGKAIDFDEILNDIGVRFWPDYARPGEAPLVHDLVLWDMATGRIPYAWAGEASLTFGNSDYDELHLLEPIEMLESHFIHLEYRPGPGTCKILHDYVAEPLS